MSFGIRKPFHPQTRNCPPQDPTLLQNSCLYQEVLAERAEVLKHKWIESEKVGHDVGFEKALLNWVLFHRSSWRKERKKIALTQTHHSEPSL